MEAYERWVHDSDGDDHEGPPVTWLVVLVCLSPLVIIALNLL
jgi:hypothetical protein